MSKCIKCGNLFINNPPDDEMCHICKIADLEAKLAEMESELEIFKKIDIENQKHLSMQANFYKHYLIKKDKFIIKQINKVKELYKKHLNYERIYDEFRVQLLEEEIDELISKLNEEN